MLGDGTQPAGEDRPRDSVTSGPRHAAPRKSLLTKLHMPAGKAVALAAMPTAVLMGMGMTPHLAQADERPASPFKAGPCVTQSQETPSATPSTTDTKGATDKGADGKASAKPTATPGADAGASGGSSSGGASPGTGTPDTPAPTTSPAAQPKKSTAPAVKTQPEPASTPSATPSPTHSVNLLDPLGLGNLLGGLLGGGKQTPQPAPTTQAPQPPATTAPATPKPADPTPSGSQSPGKPASGSSKGSTATVGKTVKSLTDKAASGASKAVKDLSGATGTPSPTASPSATPSPGPTGKQAYPCPTYDAKALADAKTEGGIPLLPDQPWTLKSNLLTLYGLNYAGIVQVRTWSGTVKDVMKFTATGVDIGNLQQVVQGPNGTTTHVSARTGSTSTIRNGTVTMYTESLSGNLLGLVPITFTPKAPPPLTLPVLFFTDATVIQAGQFGGDLTVPGLRVLPDQPAQ